jgi:hypothetical protein
VSRRSGGTGVTIENGEDGPVTPVVLLVTGMGLIRDVHTHAGSGVELRHTYLSVCDKNIRYASIVRDCGKANDQ